MRLSIIIPTYNRKNALLETLKAFCEQTYKDFEIIIVDDGSTDGTKEIVEELNLPLEIKYVFQNNRGPASARNLGIRQSKEKIVFFTGDDMVPSRNLLEEHIEAHRAGDKNTAILGYTKWAYQIKMTPFRKFLTNYHFAYSAITDKNNVYWGYFFTSNVSVHRSLLKKAGLFDEEFPYAAYEDTELGHRLFQQGMKLMLNKKAIVYHNHPVDFKSYQRTMLYKGISAVILAKKVPQLKKKAIYRETKNPLRRFLKKIVFSGFVLKILTKTICFLDKLFIPLPKLVYTKILNYYRVKGIKKYEQDKKNY